MNFRKGRKILTLLTVGCPSNQLMLAIFSKSVILPTKMPFNKSEVVAL